MASDADFEKQIEQTLAFEGGYVDDPDDAGGQTNFGISQRSYPNVDIVNLTREKAVAIYKADYWDKLPPQLFPSSIAMKLFDLSVNMGRKEAIIILQRAVNIVTLRQRLSVDGMLGPQTLTAMNAVSESALLHAIKVEASNHYQSIAAHAPYLNKYVRGWLRRANA